MPRADDQRPTSAVVGATLIGKWFVFWAVGWRLFLAGMRQIVQPGYTARVILGLKHDESQILVRELGFANVAFGAIGILSLFVPSWRLAAALAGGIFYGLAGINHVRQSHRNKLENVADGLGPVRVARAAVGQRERGRSR